MSKNYYEILGVDKSASKEEISKAFKKMSLKWHPDKWATGTDEEKKTAEEKFKEINEANSILSDDEKRRNYDMFGDPNGRAGGFSGFSDFDMSDWFGFGGFGKQPRNVKADDCHVEIDVTLSEVFNGGKREISYNKKTKCDECHGSGLGKDGKIETCPHCNGTGRIRNMQRHGYQTIIQESVCHHCHGQGKTIINPCSKCHGSGLMDTTVEDKIYIPVGIYDGATIVVRGIGCEASSERGETQNGDLYVTFNEVPHKTFKRNGNDIISEVELSICDAMCGCDVTVDCIDETKVKFKSPKITKEGRSFRFSNKGLKDPNNNNLRGDHIVIIKYKYPTEITEEQEKLLKEFDNLTKK
jgi:molecular chaperone DnaJ